MLRNHTTRPMALVPPVEKETSALTDTTRRATRTAELSVVHTAIERALQSIVTNRTRSRL
jgi:hypothetical protein